jgi:hypothetical protein
MSWLHTGCWVVNLFGLFFLLAGHEHYSIDVFIAVYISSRLFLYYHSLANNKMTLLQRDMRRVRIWFPLFSYFEADTTSHITNEYDNPVKSLANSFYALFYSIEKQSGKKIK